MSQTHMRVILLSHTPEPLSLIYAAFRQCYHSGFVDEMWQKLLSGNISKEQQTDFIEQVVASGHVSPIEHVSFTFAVQGISRALSHQLVRHRIASYSQQSQRYVDGSNFDYIIPPSIASHPEARRSFLQCIEAIGAAYKDIKVLLEVSGHARAKEDARFVLPQATETRIVVTMNCRALLNFFEQRCCTRAQWEIRAMANAMLKACREVLPVVFNKAGPRCEHLNYCPEGEKFTCGRYPLLGIKTAE